jgi:hypothetical protein
VKILALAGVLLAGVASAQETPPPEDDLRRTVEELKHRADSADAKLAKQDAELTRLRSALESETAARQAAETAARDRAPLFRLGGLSVHLAGFVQADAVAYDASSTDELNFSTGQPLNQTRFLIRRARLRIEGDYRYAGGVLEFDGNTINGPTARITNAEVYVRLPHRDPAQPPYLMVVAGLTRIPFGFEVQEKDYIRLFLERSNMIRAMFPGEYDLGAKLQGGWRWMRYQVAVMNGQPSGDKQFALRDPGISKDVVGRLGVDAPLGSRVGLQGGISGLWGSGFHTGTPPTKDTVVWHDTNLDGQIDPTELQGVLGQPGTPSQDFGRWAVGLDLRLIAPVPRLGELTVYGEIVWASNLDRAIYYADPIALGRDLREFGWYVAATQQLSRWAMVGVRYDRYDPDSDRSEKIAAQIVPRDLTLSTLSVVAAVTYPPYARLTLEWDHNTNALARLPSGAPATLGADQVTFRAQVLF